MVELVYTADLKSAPFQWVAGSSPAARTTCNALKIRVDCIHSSTHIFLKDSQGLTPLGFLLA